MKSGNTLPTGVRSGSAQWLAMQVHAVRCADVAAISSVWAHCDDDFGDRRRQRIIDARTLRCRDAERHGGTAARVRSERA